jgi:hypothetical protein
MQQSASNSRRIAKMLILGAPGWQWFYGICTTNLVGDLIENFNGDVVPLLAP